LSIAFQTALNQIGLNVAMKMERESKTNLMRSPLCFKSTSYGEISFDGKKLIGSAQKRWKDGFLQQGSIPYSVDYEKLIAVFKQYSITSELPSFRTNHEMAGLRELIVDFDFDSFKEAIKLSFEKTFNITLIESHPSYQELELTHLLCSEKYQNPRWTMGELKNNLSHNNSETRMRAL
jgi:lipoate-protein ligase A